MSLKIISIDYIGTVDDYVYDLETEDGTYYAGDDIIAKNTDSIMTSFNVHASDFTKDGVFDNNSYIKEFFKIGKECATAITKANKEPIKIELEKAMAPFNLIAKKKYFYVEWSICKIHGAVISSSEPENRPGFTICPSCNIFHTVPKQDSINEQDTEGLDVIKFKGVALARRDSCKYVKDVCNKILELSMINVTANNRVKCIEEAKKYSQQAVANLLNGLVDKNDLKLSKSLKGSYKVSKKYDGLEISKGQLFFGEQSQANNNMLRKTTSKISVVKSVKKEPEQESEQTQGQGQGRLVTQSINFDNLDSEETEEDTIKNIPIKWDNVYCSKCSIDPNLFDSLGRYNSLFISMSFANLSDILLLDRGNLVFIFYRHY